MAGLGAKKFVDTEVLYAADVNGYLMEQSIMRFATTAARDAAFGGATELTLAEGMTCYIDADNSLYSYDGSAWVKVVSSSQPPGLVLLAQASFSTASLVVSNVFTSAYTHYRLIVEQTSVTLTGTTQFQFASGGSPIATADYYYGGHVYYYNTNPTGYQAGAANALPIMIGSGSVQTMSALEITNPMTANRKTILSHGTCNFSNYIGMNHSTIVNLTASNYDGFKVFQDAGGTMTGSYRVYGYRNS